MAGGDSFRFMRVEIEAMGQRFTAMIAEHHKELQGAMKQAFEKLAAEGTLERILAEECEAGIRKLACDVFRSYQVNEALADRFATMIRETPEPARRRVR
jgi:hypothetical protein